MALKKPLQMIPEEDDDEQADDDVPNYLKRSVFKNKSAFGVSKPKLQGRDILAARPPQLC